MQSTQIVVTGIIVLLFITVIVLYNQLVRKKNAINYALSSIDALLKKRHDLIPNLVSAVTEYMKYEKSTLKELTELRVRAISPNLSPKERLDLERSISSGLRRIIVSAENYPELKSSSNFLQLQAALNEVEEQLSAARRTLSAAITEYNNSVRTFPSNIMARLMGYTEYEWFSVKEGERAEISIKELFQEKLERKDTP